MERKNISSGSEWEPKIGYSRAVQVGPFVFVSGTTGAANPDGSKNTDVYSQTKRTLQIISEALEKGGASVKDVVRTRIYLTNIADWQEAARAHGEVFGDIRPATALLEVSKFIAPEMLVEIEADAYVVGR